MGKHTFCGIESTLESDLHHLINLWCDFPELKKQYPEPPQTWDETKRKEFLNTVLQHDRAHFEKLGYYLHDGKLNWSPNPKKYVK
jgi:hypothetical protein